MAASVAAARDAYARRDWRAVYDGLHDSRDRPRHRRPRAPRRRRLVARRDAPTSMAVAEDVYQRLRGAEGAVARGGRPGAAARASPGRPAATCRSPSAWLNRADRLLRDLPPVHRARRTALPRGRRRPGPGRRPGTGGGRGRRGARAGRRARRPGARLLRAGPARAWPRSGAARPPTGFARARRGDAARPRRPGRRACGPATSTAPSIHLCDGARRPGPDAATGPRRWRAGPPRCPRRSCTPASPASTSCS